MERFALILAALVGFGVTAFSGFAIIPWLRRLKFGQTIRESGPTWHKNKQGTPTMGGLTFYLGTMFGLGAAWLLLSAAEPDLMAGNGTYNVLLALATSYLFGLVGFIDDYVKVVKKRNLGLKAQQKIVAQVLITLSFLFGLHLTGTLTTVVSVPMIGTVNFGLLYYPIAFFGIIFVVNAVNLTDGIDGLAASVAFVSMLGYLIIAGILGYFHVSVFASAVGGACVGFLVWNFHPARVFMGDTGSMFLGGLVTTMAFCIGRPELLVFIATVFILDALTVVIQVCYFKATHGKRIFKMTPIHHAFEMDGWSEEKIVAAFSLTAFCFVLLGLLFVRLS